MTNQRLPGEQLRCKSTIMELGADGLPVLPAKDQAEINAMKRQAQEAEMAALKLLGEDTSGAVKAKPLSMFNRVSSAARAAQRQTAQYLRLRASRDFEGLLGAVHAWFIDTSAPPEGAGAGAHAREGRGARR